MTELPKEASLCPVPNASDSECPRPTSPEGECSTVSYPRASWYTRSAARHKDFNAYVTLQSFLFGCETEYDDLLWACLRLEYLAKEIREEFLCEDEEDDVAASGRE